MQKPAPGQRGMTLLEVMVALLISSIGLLGMLALVGVVLRGSDFSRRVTEASLIAQTHLERLVSVPKAQLAAQCAATNGTWTGTGGVSAPITYQFNCSLTPTCPPLTCININVTWNDSAGRLHTVTQQRARAP